MEELTKLLSKIELTADDVIDTKQQIVNLDAKRHKTREAASRLKEIRERNPSKKHWICVGDMFIKLNGNDARNILQEDQYHVEEGVEKLRDQLKEKVETLRELEGKPQITGFNLKPLKRQEIEALRVAFKV